MEPNQIALDNKAQFIYFVYGITRGDTSYILVNNPSIDTEWWYIP